MFFLSDKPLKKRKQDSYPQEPGTESNDGAAIHGGNSVSKMTPKKTNAASNGASRPALMVSIDLQQAGRVIGQPVVVLESQPLCEDHLRRLKSNPDGKIKRVGDDRPGIIKQHADTLQKSGSDGQPEMYKQKQESQRESKHRHDDKSDSSKGPSDDRRPDPSRQKLDKHSKSRHKEEKNHNSHRMLENRPDTPKNTSKTERSRHGEDKGRDRDRDKDRERHKDRDRARDRDKERNIEKEKERDRDKDRHKEKERDRDKEKNIEKERDRDKEKERDRDKDRHIEKEKERDKAKDRDRKQKMLRENCSRNLADPHTKPDSTRLKHDGSKKSADPNSRQRTGNSSLKNPQNKDQKTSEDGNIKCQAGDKRQSFEAKPSEFPSYLLGGKSGTLKNFVIPKLKRDGKDKDPPNKLVEGWSEPRVRLERVSLVDNLNKGAKPVVVVKKLSVDEVKKIIKESRNVHGSRSRNWSFCERTNKRSHSMISKRSKYAELASDDDQDKDDDEDSDNEREYRCLL